MYSLCEGAVIVREQQKSVSSPDCVKSPVVADVVGFASPDSMENQECVFG